MSSLDVQGLRHRFPALGRTTAGHATAYLDGPAGTQVPDSVIAAMAAYQECGVSNLGGAFDVSLDTGEVETAARDAVADLIGADPGEVVFGQNMTSLTFSISRALSREWGPADSVVVTTLDHDANVSPWRMAAEDRGAAVRVVEIDRSDATLDMASLERALAGRPRLVAVTAASNAVGTVTPLREIVKMAHEGGALVYVDAVHYSAHRLSDVHALGADFLAASSYKFFGPHTGLLYGKAEHLERLTAYKVRPAPATGPGKWETGTQSFESLAGVTAAIDYLASLGEGADRRSRLVDGFGRIRRHEEALSLRFLTGLGDLPAVKVSGIRRADRLGERVSTFAISVGDISPREVAARLGAEGVLVWDGHYYAVAVMEALGFLDRGGLVRIGFVHYNTESEVDRTLEILAHIAG